MGNISSNHDDGLLLDSQCCSTRHARERIIDCGDEIPQLRNAPALARNADDNLSSVEESGDLYGVGLVFRTTRDGKLVVSSFIRDSSAFECGLVRDGGKFV